VHTNPTGPDAASDDAPPAPPAASQGAPDAFARWAAVAEAIRATTKRLAKGAAL